MLRTKKERERDEKSTWPKFPGSDKHYTAADWFRIALRGVEDVPIDIIFLKNQVYSIITGAGLVLEPDDWPKTNLTIAELTQRDILLDCMKVAEDQNFDFYKDGDGFRTHTIVLAHVHERLGLPGVFHTKSTGKDSNNCMLYRRGDDMPGAFNVFRFGGREEPPWEQRGNDWFLVWNKDPDLRIWTIRERGAAYYAN